MPNKIKEKNISSKEIESDFIVGIERIIEVYEVRKYGMVLSGRRKGLRIVNKKPV